MTGVDKAKEDEFYRILGPFLDLERNTARKYTREEYNLERMPMLAELFGNPERDLRVLHVAGTKGKGSVCYYATALLTRAGHRVGTFTSPHLITFRERMLLNGECPPYDLLLDHTREIVERVLDASINATFFEVLTIIGLSFFRDQSCEFAMLETGIGGRLDCTNYVSSPECTAITAVSFDHTALLGDTIAEIATEKAGIIKRGVPIVCGPQPYPEAQAVIHQRALAKNAPFIPTQPLPGNGQFEDLAPFQRENLAVAMKMVETCGIGVLHGTFVPPQVPGRLQVVRESPLVIVDAAHNVDSARRLVEAINSRYPDVDFTCVLGITAGKDAVGILEQLMWLADRFILTNPRLDFKGSELDALKQYAETANLQHRVVPRIESVSDLPPNTPLLFTGSFFTATIGVELFPADYQPLT